MKAVNIIYINTTNHSAIYSTINEDLARQAVFPFLLSLITATMIAQLFCKLLMNTYGLSVGLEAPKVSKVSDIGRAPSLSLLMYAHSIMHPILDQ